MTFKVNYVILIITVKNYNYDYSFFVWRNVIMIDVLKYYVDNVKENEYYYKFYNKIVTQPQFFTKSFGAFGIEDDLFYFNDVEQIIEKFKFLCQPDTNVSTSHNKRLFYFLCFYLHKNGYVIKEFPRILKCPPDEPSEFTYNEIRNKIMTQGKQRTNGVVPHSERRILVANLTFQQNTTLEINDNIDSLFQKISTRNAIFDSMSADEKLKEISNLIEYMLLENNKFKILNYSIIMFDYINNDIITKYRKQIQCFRHASTNSIEERKIFSDEQKSFLIDYGITIIKVIYDLINGEN